MSEQIKVFFSYGHDRHGEVVKRLAQAIERLSGLYSENPAYLRGLCVSLERVAGIYETQNNPEEALKLYGEASAIRKRLNIS